MIFVDADSCEKNAREFTLRAAEKKGTKVVFAANKDIQAPFKSSLFKMQICPKEKDSADNFIAENAAIGDIVITRDLLLAERILKRGITVMNDKGTVFTEKKLDYMLEERALSLQMKSLGVSTGGKGKCYGKSDLSSFKKTLTELLDSPETFS
ncbi:DUF188 domain-containing protein [Treponema sp.]|uniref:DUF188 domain-containing protein n=1 Tax=Treponema sp. TaxID=166 RepID=UPI003F0E9CD7